MNWLEDAANGKLALYIWWIHVLKIVSNDKIDAASWCKSSSIYYLYVEATENTVDGEYTESELSKPLLEKSRYTDDTPPTIVKNYDKRNSIKRKSTEEAINRPNDACVVPNVEGIELANDAVCPFGLAKNLEKQICIIPSRKKSKFSATNPTQFTRMPPIFFFQFFY